MTVNAYVAETEEVGFEPVIVYVVAVAGDVGIPEIKPVAELNVRPESVRAGAMVNPVIAPPEEAIAYPPIALPTIAVPALDDNVKAGGAY